MPFTRGRNGDTEFNRYRILCFNNKNFDTDQKTNMFTLMTGLLKFIAAFQLSNCNLQRNFVQDKLNQMS